jgi:hypothetical protein
MPFRDTPAMQAHLDEISAAVAPDAHAVLILDRAGWHLARALVVPRNITLLPPPPRSPKLNPVENIWQFMRDNWLSNGSSRATTTSSPIAAPPGTTSSTSLGASDPSESELGRKGSDQCRLVLAAVFTRDAAISSRLCSLDISAAAAHAGTQYDLGDQVLAAVGHNVDAGDAGDLANPLHQFNA